VPAKTYGCLETNYTVWLEIPRQDFVDGKWVNIPGVKVHFGLNRTSEPISDESKQEKLEATSQFKSGFIYDLEKGPKIKVPSVPPTVVTGKRHVGRSPKD